MPGAGMVVNAAAASAMKVPAIAPDFERLGTETAFAVLARAKALEARGEHVVHLEIGEPDAPTAEHISQAAFAAMRAGETHYCAGAGISELREVAATHLSRTRDVAIPADRVLIGSGAKLLLFLTVLATCGPGDEVVFPSPGFPIYESAVRWVGATPVPLPLGDADQFTFGGDELAACVGPRTKLVILNSPHNPTGAMLSEAQLRTVADCVEQTDAWILADEVYSRIVYERPFCSIASMPGMLERTVVLDSLSKTYAMTGWRCGYAAVPEPLVEPITRLIVNSTSCVPPFIQRAAIAALSGPQDAVQSMCDAFRQRRDFTVARLNGILGISCHVPAGAFYAFPDVSATSIPAGVLADRLLHEAGVAVLAGDAFGAAGRGHLRLSYAASEEQLDAGLARIERLIRGRNGQQPRTQGRNR